MSAATFGATAPTTTPLAVSRTARSDGEETRARLLRAALRLFAEHGFSQTSVRRIAEEAGANVAAIRYHFGDKAGLYGATFSEPLGSASALIPAFAAPELSLEAALRAYFGGYLAPLKHDDLVRQCVRLHVRELLEPTPHVGASVRERESLAPHRALVELLRRHTGVRRVDDDLHRLAFAIEGLVMQLWTQRDEITAIAPRLVRASAIDGWAQRLTGFALAMVRSETQRRQTDAPRPARAARRKAPARKATA